MSRPIVRGALVWHTACIALCHKPPVFRASPFKFLGLMLLVALGLYGLFVWLFSEMGLTFHGTVWLSNTPLFTVSLAAVVGAGAALGIWWLQTRFITLRITTVRSLLRRGIISKQTSEVRHRDVRNLQVDQNIFERIVGVGDIAISSAGQDDLEVEIAGIPQSEHIANRVRQMQ